MGGILDAVMGAGVLQGLFMAAALARRGRGGRLAELALAGLMLVFAANALHAGFLRGLFPAALAGRAPATYEPFQLLLGPASWLYVRLVSGATERDRAFRASDALPFLPALAAMLLVPPLSILLPPSAERWAALGFWAFSAAYLLACVAASSRLVHAHRARLKEEYSSIGAADLAWVRDFMLAFLALETLDLVLFAWLVHGNPFPYFGKLEALVSTLLAYALGYRGLARRADAAPRIETDPPVDMNIAGKVERPAVPKYARSGLDDAALEAVAGEIRACMERERPWLEPEFSLSDLADRLGRPRNVLSQAVNSAFGVNFWDFVNGYRVDEVRRLLAAPGAGRRKLLAVALDAGFASKNTFNAAFKKLAGATPSAFRRGTAAETPEKGPNG